MLDPSGLVSATMKGLGTHLIFTTSEGFYVSTLPHANVSAVHPAVYPNFCKIFWIHALLPTYLILAGK